MTLNEVIEKINAAISGSPAGGKNSEVGRENLVPAGVAPTGDGRVG